MCFQGKCKIQIQKNAEKHHFGPNLGPLGPNLDCHFFSDIWLCQSPDIMFRYHHVKYQKKLMIQSGEILVTDKWSDGQIDRRE